MAKVGGEGKKRASGGPRVWRELGKDERES